jgi:hypothetical protein
MPGLNRAPTARRPADVVIGLRGIAASKIELSNKILLVCYTFGRLATSKPRLIAGTICGVIIASGKAGMLVRYGRVVM